MNKQDYEKAAAFWKSRESASKCMSENDLKTKMDQFLSTHNTCALATGFGTFVRCTPLEYTWMDQKLYILSEGGEKFRGLADNNNVSLSVYESYKGFGKIESLQISGKADLIDFGTDEYKKLLTFKKIPETAISSLSHPMYLIRISPETIDFLFSEFKKEGYDPRQRINQF